MQLVLTQETPGSISLMENKNPYILRCDKMDTRSTEPLKEQSSPLFLFRSTPRYLHSTNTDDKPKSPAKVMLFSKYWIYSWLLILCFLVPLRKWQPCPVSLLTVIYIFFSVPITWIKMHDMPKIYIGRSFELNIFSNGSLLIIFTQIS